MAKRFQPVLTLPGFAILLFSLVILIRSLIARNAYEVLLSAVSLLFLAALFFTGKWSLRKLAALEPLLRPPFPLAAASKEEWLVTVPVVKVPRFFRLHFLMKGRFFPQGQKNNLQDGAAELKVRKPKFRSVRDRIVKQSGGCPVFAETSLSRNGDASVLSVGFPLGGLFRGEESCRLRDIFGFFSFPCGLIRERALQVRNAPPAMKPLRIDARSGAEDRRNKTTVDEERYYMREYAPGDRFRDINWKSSERIDTLITRISPDNQDKVTRIEVLFRNYGPSRPSINELWLLDRAKARLAWFLRTIKEEKQSYIFCVRAAQGKWELADQDEIDSFLDELSSLPFSPVQNEDSISPDAETGAGDIYVFSTACDAGLSAFILSMQNKPFSLFMAQNKTGMGNRRRKQERAAAECERLYLRDFIAGGSVPLPGWLLQKRNNRHGSGGIRALTDYAEICL